MDETEDELGLNRDDVGVNEMEGEGDVGEETKEVGFCGDEDELNIWDAVEEDDDDKLELGIDLDELKEDEEGDPGTEEKKEEFDESLEEFDDWMGEYERKDGWLVAEECWTEGKWEGVASRLYKSGIVLGWFFEGDKEKWIGIVDLKDECSPG